MTETVSTQLKVAYFFSYSGICVPVEVNVTRTRRQMEPQISGFL